MSSDTLDATAEYWRMRRLTDDPGLVLVDPGLTAAGTSEGARRAWESRQRANKPPAGHTAPTPAPSKGVGNGLPTADEFDAMEHTGGPLGSQGGGWYKDASGQRYLVKPGQSKSHAMNELAAHLLYKQAGIPTDDTGIFEHNGEWFIAKKAVQGVDGKLGKQVGNGGMTADMQRQARDGFGVDALASSWDAFGLVGDNVIMNAGVLHRIDVGGSMMFRAMGGDKPSFNPGKEWIEPSTLRSSNQGKQLYGNMTNAEAAHQLAKLQQLDVDAYDRQLASTGIDANVRQRVIATIRDRIDNQLPGILHHLDPGLTAAGTPEGARKAWDARGRGDGVLVDLAFATDKAAKTAFEDAVGELDQFDKGAEEDRQSEFDSEYAKRPSEGPIDDYVGNYIDYGYEDINQALKSGNVSEELAVEVAGLDKVITDLGSPSPAGLMRGKGERSALRELGWEVGHEFTDKGYGSWTPKSDIALGFAKGNDQGSVLMHLTNSTKVDSIPGKQHEYESILPRGMRYRVTGISDFVGPDGTKHRVMDVEAAT